MDWTPICRFAFELPKVCSGSVGFGGGECEIDRSAIARRSQSRARAREVERSAPGSGLERARERRRGLKIRDVISASGVTTARWKRGPGVERAELRTRTPFVVRYLYAPVLGRATRHGRCEKRGKGIGGQAGQCRPEIRVRGDHARFGREMRAGSPRGAEGAHHTSVGTAPASTARSAYRARSRGRALEPVATSYRPRVTPICPPGERNQSKSYSALERVGSQQGRNREIGN